MSESERLDKVFALCSVVEQDEVVIGFATPRLLSNAYLAANSPTGAVLMVDDTFKLTICKYKLIVTGVVDLQQVFHPLAVFLVDQTSCQRYSKAFAALKNAICKYGCLDSETQWAGFKAGLSDGDLGIRKAARQVFGRHFRWLDCWFHVTQGD